ncbi:hypothetical protein [Sulfolobus islandicus rudivirus 1 variant XX]|nr:hypothetical protein [Sulfolobus islandicus rudivirus 1 variant XX]
MSSTCYPITSFGNLLNKIAKQSLISSQVWNEIVQDLYTAYSVYKYINTTLQYQLFYGNIYTLYDLFNNLDLYILNAKPYPFTPLIQARPGLPLTVNYMNNLINAITKVANENNIALAKPLNFVQSNEIVTSRKINDIIYAINQFLTFDYNTYFLLDCNGSLFNNLINSKSAFLNVLIDNPSQNISTNNIYIKNLIINYLNTFLNFYGSSAIDNLLVGKTYTNFGINTYDNSYIQKIIMYQLYGLIETYNNSYIQKIIVNELNGAIETNDNSYIDTIIVNQLNNAINAFDNSYIKTVIINQFNGSMYILSYIDTIIFTQLSIYLPINTGNHIGNLIINTNYGTPEISDSTVLQNFIIDTNYQEIDIDEYAIIKNLIINTNYGTVKIYDNAIVENLICKQNYGQIQISGNAQVINNNCQ